MLDEPEDMADEDRKGGPSCSGSSSFAGLPSLASVFDEKDDNRQGRDIIHPPPSRLEHLNEVADDHDTGEGAGSNRFDRIGAKFPAADLISNPDLLLW